MISKMFTPSAIVSHDELWQGTKFILTENEKWANDRALVKDIFRHHEDAGIEQVVAKQHYVRRLYQLAEGVINERDYVETEVDYKNMVKIGNEQKLAVDNLDFYPIIPTIVRAALGTHDKNYSEYIAQAVNPDVTNTILERMNEELRTTLISNVEALFQMQTENDEPDVVEQKRKLMQESATVQQFYKQDYRTTVEEWGQHVMNLENERFRMKEKERKVLKQIVVTDDPVVHIDHTNGNYNVEVLDERETFCMRSPGSEDYSDSQVFGWFEFLTFTDVLNRFSNQISDKEMERVSGWSMSKRGTGYLINDLIQPFSPGQRIAEAKHNLEIIRDTAIWQRFSSLYRDLGMDTDLVRLTTMYFYVPRKVGVLTVRSNNTEVTEMVDEQFKVTIKPVYEPGMPRKVEYLVLGEHVEWMYIPELWRGKKLSAKTSEAAASVSGGPITSVPNVEDIWVELGRCEIQHSDPYHKYAIHIPVHGGSITDQFGQSTSVVKTAAPWQIMFNWVHNRAKQLLSTEIGKFFMLPNSLIPTESLEGSWEQDSLGQFATVARDTGLAPTSNPLAQGGAASLALQGGYGQVVDLTKTQEIIEKTNLASIFKTECYHSVGLTPEYLLGDMAPSQSARSTAMGQDRSATQIRHLFTRLNEVMLRVRTTMLNTAKHIAQKSPTAELSYTTSEAGRVLFRTATEDFSLQSLGVFVKSNGSDLATVEMIKQYVANNNTMGADSVEMSTLLSFKSLPELFSKLKIIRDEREQQKEREMAHQQQMQQQQIQAQQAAQQAEIEARAEEKALDRESRIMEAQIKAMGYAQDDAQGIQDSILRLQSANADQQAMYERAKQQFSAEATRELQTDRMLELKSKDLASREIERMKAIEQKDRELDLRAKEIEARNRRTQKID